MTKKERDFWVEMHRLLLAAVTAVERYKLGSCITTKEMRDWYKRIVKSGSPPPNTEVTD